MITLLYKSKQLIQCCCSIPFLSLFGLGNLNFFPVYSKAITGIHAFLYNDSSYSSLDQTLITDDTSSFSFQIDLNSDKYLKLIPYERYGSGHHYNPQTNFGIHENVNQAPDTAKINLKSFQTISGERFARVYGNTSLQSYSGYHLDFSIYTGNQDGFSSLNRFHDLHTASMCLYS